MNATACHSNVYSRVMNAAVILEQKDICGKDSPNVILACQPIIMLSSSDAEAATMATPRKQDIL